ncbi:MAG: GNAT family N-acetyltransferase [Oscillochloridaceae bacterium umkhey_bin13]
MSNPPFLAPLSYQTAAFLLRAYQPGDGAALQQAVLASYPHLQPWMPWAKAEQTVDESEVIVRQFAGKYLMGTDFVLGIWMGDELVGGTGYHLRWGSLSEGIAEVGMWISADRAHAGLGTRVLAALLAWGFTAWPWRRMLWRCDTRNLASARVAAKNGFRLEGTLRADLLAVDGSYRDCHYYAILREEWEGHQG